MEENALITGEDLSRARSLVTQLMPHRSKLTANASNMVSHLSAKFEQYGDRTFVSKEQFGWLLILEKHLPDQRQQSLF